MPEYPMIHVRLPKALVKRVDHARIDLDMRRGRARMIEALLEIALDRLDSMPSKENRDA